VKAQVMKPDGIDEGIGEAGIAEELGKVVQFERYGFVRINFLGEPIVAYFAHR
jgi:glutamyl-tRNA synthetase